MKITTEVFQRKEGDKIFVNVDCERNLEIILDLVEFKIFKVHKYHIDGKEVQDFQEISKILECVRKKIL